MSAPLRLLALALLSLPVHTQGAGSRLPPLELEGFTQTDATSFEDYTGRAVMLDFFAHWCGPCARSVPHINGLQKKWGPRGLSVIGVTDDTPEKAEPWMKRHGAKYAYAYDKSDLARALGVDSIPRAVLIDVHGTVLFNGHPSKLDGALIEQAVKGAFPRPMWEWDGETEGVRKALRRGALGPAVEQARKLSAEHSGPAIVASIEGLVEGKLELLRAAQERGDYLAVVQTAERLTGELEGLPAAGDVKLIAETVRQDPEAKEIIRAQRQVARIRQRRFRTREEVSEAIVELEKLRAGHGGTYVEGEARALIKGFERMIKGR